MEEELTKKVERAIKLIQSASKIAAENGCPEIEVCYSSGKDSDVILELTKMSGVPYRAIYRNTTIDPAGTIKHCLDNGCEIVRPKRSFLSLIPTNGLPSRRSRYCCEYLKEYKILDYALLGIRAEESSKRKERYKEPEFCRVYHNKSKVRQYLPILDWSSDDVEQFIEHRGIKCHPLYYDKDGTFHVERRLGCMCCPLVSQKNRLNEFQNHPNMVKLYVRGCRKYLQLHPNGNIRKYVKDEYEMFCLDVYCERNFEKFQIKFGPTLFDEGVSCKSWLEQKYGITFK